MLDFILKCKLQNMCWREAEQNAVMSALFLSVLPGKTTNQKQAECSPKTPTFFLMAAESRTREICGYI